MNKAIQFLLSFIMLTVSSGDDVPFRDCGSQVQITRFVVENCSTQRCEFAAGSTMKLRIGIDRVLVDDISAIYTATVTHLGLSYTADVMPMDACQVWHCPVWYPGLLHYEPIINIPQDIRFRSGATITLKGTTKSGVIMCVNFSFVIQ